MAAARLKPPPYPGKGRIPTVRVRGLDIPAGYRTLWAYYGTLSFYVRPGGAPDPDAAGKRATIAYIRQETGWPEYKPGQPAPVDPVEVPRGR